MANIVLSSNSCILLKSLYVTASLVQSQGRQAHVHAHTHTHTHTHTNKDRIVVWYYNIQYHPLAKNQPITRSLPVYYNKGGY